MEKIAIVSCYSQNNYGSMLQAYATQQVLDKMGYDNETIDITDFSNQLKRKKIMYFLKATFTSDILLSKIGLLKNVLIKKILKTEYSCKAKIREKRFKLFYQDRIRLSKKVKSLVDLSDMCKERYSAVLVGSDQLWLPWNIEADYYTLSFVIDTINTIAYATSFGQSSLPKNTTIKARTYLNKIRHIGVREYSGQKIIKEITGRNVPIVADPTLLFTGEEWKELFCIESIIKEPYILCYFLGNNPPHREFAKRLKEKTEYKIILLPHLDEYIKSDEYYADKLLYDVDPFDFLNLILNAEYVCTDSFHCSVFSMLFCKRFFVFERYNRKTKLSTNSRIDSLLKIAGTEKCLLNGQEDIVQCMNLRIDYNLVETKLNILRKNSYEYLIGSLKDEGSTDI